MLSSWCCIYVCMYYVYMYVRMYIHMCIYVCIDCDSLWLTEYVAVVCVWSRRTWVQNIVLLRQLVRSWVFIGVLFPVLRLQGKEFDVWVGWWGLTLLRACQCQKVVNNSSLLVHFQEYGNASHYTKSKGRAHKLNLQVLNYTGVSVTVDWAYCW